MYAVYFYVAGATAANILADVIKILTGTTNVNDLSVSCNKVKSSIIAIESAGWELYDAAAGVNAVCVRAPVYDNPNQYKYMVVDTNTPGYIFTKIYEAWNSTTHTGTNLSLNSGGASYNQRLSTAGAGRLDIKATVRQCFMFGVYVTNASGLIYGCSSGSINAPTGVTEFIRYSHWDTIANGYPNYAFMVLGITTGAVNTAPPRLLGAVAETDVVTTSSALFVVSIGLDTMLQSVKSFASSTAYHATLGDDKKYRIPMNRVAIGSLSDRAGGGEITALSDIYMTLYGRAPFFAKIKYNGNDYVIWSTNINWYFALKYA